MNIEELINEKCPNGVEYKNFSEVAELKKGTQLNKDTLFDEGDYPVINGGINPSGYWNEYNVEGNSISISQGGASAGYVNFIQTPFWAGAHCYFVDNQSFDGNYKYLYYVVKSYEKSLMSSQEGAGIPSVSSKKINELQIPIPPIEIQNEIVNILDKFTELEAELEAELGARKKQYEHYRDKLLNFSGDGQVTLKTIGELSSYRRGSFPQPYGNAERYDGEGAMPFVQVADIGDDKRLVEDTKRKISKLAQPMSVFAPKGTIIISLQGSIGKIAITQYDAYIDRTVAIFSGISDLVLEKYFVYQLERIFAIKEKTARGGIIKTITKEEFTEFPIPVPSLEEQKRIVNILDRFETLTNDITEGLPAEIQARQKQYEYYRDRLLTFNEA